MLAILDGTVTDASQAQIPVADDGFLRGDGVFEVMRLYGGRLFALDDHLTRLGRSAANLRLPVDLEAVRADVETLVEHNDVPDAAMRVVVTRGGHRLAIVWTARRSSRRPSQSTSSTRSRAGICSAWSR